MALFEDFMVPCTRLERVRVADGEGGWRDAWTDGDGFKAAVVLDSSLNARVAEKQGVTGVYTVTAERGAGLRFHDAFRRESDGATFRVVKVLDATPSMATFQFDQCTAESWEVPA